MAPDPFEWRGQVPDTRGLDDADPNTRYATLLRLSDSAEPMILPAILALAEKETTPHVKDAAIRLLGEIGDVRALPLLYALAHPLPPAHASFLTKLFSARTPPTATQLAASGALHAIYRADKTPLPERILREGTLSGAEKLRILEIVKKLEKPFGNIDAESHSLPPLNIYCQSQRIHGLNPAVRLGAQTVLDAMEAREQNLQRRDGLVSPASAPPTPSEELLRPAQDAGNTAPSLLLRPAEQINSRER